MSWSKEISRRKFLRGALGLGLVGGLEAARRLGLGLLYLETPRDPTATSEQLNPTGELALNPREYQQITATPQDEMWVALALGGLATTAYAWTELSDNRQWDIFLQQSGEDSPVNLTEDFGGQNFAPVLAGDLATFSTVDRQTNFKGYTVINLADPTQPPTRIASTAAYSGVAEPEAIDNIQKIQAKRQSAAENANNQLGIIRDSIIQQAATKTQQQDVNLADAQQLLDVAKTEQDRLLSELVSLLHPNPYPAPSLTYNPQKEEYLLGFGDIDSGRIQAQRLNRQGQLIEQPIELVKENGYTPRIIADERGFTHLVYVDTSASDGLGWRIKYHIYNTDYEQVISYDLALDQDLPGQFQPAIARGEEGVTAITYTARNGHNHWDTHVVFFTDTDTDDNKQRITQPLLVGTGSRDQVGQGVAAIGNGFVVIYTNTAPLEAEDGSTPSSWHLDASWVSFNPTTNEVAVSQQPTLIFNNLVRWPLGAPSNLGAYMYRSAITSRPDSTIEVVAPLQDPITGQIDLHKKTLELDEQEQPPITWSTREVVYRPDSNMFDPVVLVGGNQGDNPQPLFWWQVYSGESDRQRIFEMYGLSDIDATGLDPQLVASDASLIQATVAQGNHWVIYQKAGGVEAIKNPNAADGANVRVTEGRAFHPTISARFNRNGKELSPIAAYGTEDEQGLHLLKTKILGSDDIREVTVKLPQQVTTIHSPRLAVNKHSGNLYLVVETNIGVFVSSSDTQGESWKQAKKISGNESNLAQEPEVAVADDGTVAIAWVGKQDFDFGNIYLVTSSDGVNWNPSTPVNEKQKERTCGSPAITIIGNFAIIIYGDVKNKAETARRLWGFEPNCAIYNLSNDTLVGNFPIGEHDPQDPTGIADISATVAADGQLSAVWGRKQRGRTYNSSIDQAKGTIDPAVLGSNKLLPGFKL